MDEGQVSDQENVGPRNEHSGRLPGSKISEKIKAMQCGMLDDGTCQLSSAPKKQIELGNVPVKNLALNLNINPLTLRVGAKPPKPKTVERIDDLDKEVNDVDVPSGPTQPLEISEATITVTSSILPKNEDEVTDHYMETIKGRVKIQQKRRPPSNRILKSSPFPEETKAVGVHYEKDADSGTDYEPETCNSPQLEPSSENSESEQPEKVEPNKEKKGMHQDMDTDPVMAAALNVNQEPEPVNEASLEPHKTAEVEKTSTLEDSNSLLFYIIHPFTIPRNIGWFITVAASIIILLIIPILLQAFITTKEEKRSQ